MATRQKQSLASLVGLNIMRLRQAKGWSQKDLAGMMGMGADSLSRMERGFVAPRFGRLEKLAEVLSCTVAELFLDTSTPEAAPKVLTPREELCMLTERLRALLQRISEAQVQEEARGRRCRVRRPRNKNRLPEAVSV